MERLRQVFGVSMLGAALYYVSPLMPERVVLLLTGAFLIGIAVFGGALDRPGPGAGVRARLKTTAGILCLTLGVACAARFVTDGAPKPAPRAADPPGISWMDEESRALAAADRRNTPVIIDFYADWCVACKDLDEKTFADPRVVAAAEGFVALRVDSSDPAAPGPASLRRKYGIVGLPTIVFIDRAGGGVEHRTVTEFVPPEDLLGRMAEVSARPPAM